MRQVFNLGSPDSSNNRKHLPPSCRSQQLRRAVGSDEATGWIRWDAVSAVERAHVYRDFEYVPESISHEHRGFVHVQHEISVYTLCDCQYGTVP